MKLIKVKNGLLEAENFFLASPFNDFAGNSKVSRDLLTNKLNILSNDKIERKFNFNEFVLEIKKNSGLVTSITDSYSCYVGNDLGIYGVVDDISSQHDYWKLIMSDGYIQVYASDNSLVWTNLGGASISGDITKQGFNKEGINDFILEDYKLYSSPYITIQNFIQNTKCELYDSNHNLLKTRLFDSNMECKIYLDNNNFETYLVFKDIDDSVIYTTDNLNLNYGDVWIISPYNFEVIYLGSIVTEFNPAILQDLNEMVVIKNVGDKDYTNIVISTKTSGNDLIQLSMDGINYSNTITLDIAQNEEKQIYVNITKNADNHNFKVRNFQLVIDE